MQSWFVTGETVHTFMTQEMLGWRCKAQVTPTLFRWPRRNHPPPRMAFQFTSVNHCSNNVDLLQPICVFDLIHFQFRKLFGRCFWTICKIGYCSVAMFMQGVYFFPLDRGVSSNWLFCQDQDSGGSEVGFPVARRSWNRFGFGEADEELPCLGKWSIPSYMYIYILRLLPFAAITVYTCIIYL